MSDEAKVENVLVQQGDDYVYVELEYPRTNRNRSIRIGLSDVRAADDIRVSYDFDRDGWKIEQASVFQWAADDEVCDEGWTEAAFIPAWQFDKSEEPAGREILPEPPKESR